MKGWKKVYQSGNPIEAEIMRSMLEEQGIDAVVMNHRDSSLLFGNAEVWCREEDETIALNWIMNQNHETPE